MMFNHSELQKQSELALCFFNIGVVHVRAGAVEPVGGVHKNTRCVCFSSDVCADAENQVKGVGGCGRGILLSPRVSAVNTTSVSSSYLTSISEVTESSCSPLDGVSSKLKPNEARCFLLA